MHMFIFESHSPPAFLQSASVLAFDTSPAKAGPVKASATAITNIDVRVFMGLDPYAGASPVRQRPLWIFCSGNAQTTRRVSWAGLFEPTATQKEGTPVALGTASAPVPRGTWDLGTTDNRSCQFVVGLRQE